MKINETFRKIVDLDLANGNVPFLAGNPGIGKTSVAKAVAASRNSKAFVISCNQLADKGDLTGARLMPTPDGKSFEQQFFPHHKLQRAIEYALANPNDWVILILDEINRTTADVTSAALSISTERELGNQKLPDNVKIIVTGNIRGNVTVLDDASLSRFSVYQVEADAQTLVNYLGANIHSTIKAVLDQHPEAVYQESRKTSVVMTEGDDDEDASMASISDLTDNGEEMSQLTTPRTIEYMNHWMNTVDQATLQELIQTNTVVNGREITMLQEVFEAHLGDTDFTTYLLKEVSDSLSSGVTMTPAGVQIPRPGIYDQLKGSATITDMENLIVSMTANDKSGSLLTAITEREDNTTLIQQLAAHTDAMLPEHTSVMVQAASNGQVDNDNAQVLIGTNTPVGVTTQNLLTALGF